MTFCSPWYTTPLRLPVSESTNLHMFASCRCTLPLHHAATPWRCNTLTPVHFTTKITLLASNQAPIAPNSLNDISNT
ncbi:hypothetical protein DY000_02035527 [Brassica cretica]|uniref:Uncharacterized protein n=1 Tax=Brassica cretica TaxID=69181 RepID=A0ABQ7DB66_BRACR|nr:hypothetical protein DY000_02035527 [Brassica cretica]